MIFQNSSLLTHILVVKSVFTCKTLPRWWGYLCEARRKGNFMLCVSPTAQLLRRNAWNSFETNQHSILFRQPFHNNTACSQGMHPGYHSLSLIWVQWLQPISLWGICEWIDLCCVHKRSTEIHFQHDIFNLHCQAIFSWGENLI